MNFEKNCFQPCILYTIKFLQIVIQNKEHFSIFVQKRINASASLQMEYKKSPMNHFCITIITLCECL